MFNESIKREFIKYRLDSNDVPFSPKYLDNWFSKSAAIEEELGKDLCNFTKEEILNFYKSIETSSYLTLRTFNSQLNIYFQWCFNKGIASSSENIFETVTKEELFQCVNLEKKTSSIITREKLEKWCDYEIRNFRDQYIFLCLFEGIKGKDYSEIINLSYGDIFTKTDQSGNKYYYAHVKGDAERTIEISEKLYFTALSAYETDDYTTLGESGKIIQLKSDEQRIFKGFMNQDLVNKSSLQKGKVLYTIVKRNLDDISGASNKKYGGAVLSTMSPRTIQLSGMIHFVQCHSKEKGISPLQYVSQEEGRKELGEQFGVNISKTYFIDRNIGLLD